MSKIKNRLCFSLQGDQKILENFQNVAHVHTAQANAEMFTNIHQDHTQALSKIATATQADRTSVPLLTKTIS